MPKYVPTEPELDAVFNAVRAARFVNLPGSVLLIQLNALAEGYVPITGIPPRLAAHPRSQALAVGLAMTWPSQSWNSREARGEFSNIRSALLEAWSAQKHKPTEMLRKTIDHLVVCGIRRGWSAAREVLTWLLLGNRRLYLPGHPPLPKALGIGPIGASVRFLRGRPLPRGVIGPGEHARGTDDDGLIPDLDCCWEGDFGNDSNGHVAQIMHRLLQPLVVLPGMPEGTALHFVSDTGGVSFRPQYFEEPVLSGSRRNFRLVAGAGVLLKNGAHFGYVPEGQRLMLRVFDGGHAQIKLAEFRRGTVGGRELDLDPGDTATFGATDLSGKSLLEAWTCTCGTWQCDKRHRLSSWNPVLLPEDASLSSFLWTAVKGPKKGFRLKAFITGMYYALLCDDPDRYQEPSGSAI